MSSIKDVAEMAGVSIATVSRYVNSPKQVRAPTAKKVEDAIRKTGYQANALARNFRTGKTQQIMVVLPSVGIPFYAPIVEGVRRIADAANYHILVMETAFNSVEFDDFSKMILRKQTDGIILMSTLSPFNDQSLNSHETSHETQPPIVLGLESISPELSQYPCVCIDNQAAARDATLYLIGLGHKDIGFIHGNIELGRDSESESLITKSRAQGYRDAMASRNLAVNEDWIIRTFMSVSGGRCAVKELLSKKLLPTALFCANDEIALGAMFELKRAGIKIPKDISIIGLDNMSYSEISDPPLTTIEQPAYKIGEQSMKRLLKLIAGEPENKIVEIVPHRLVVRESCATPRTN